MAKLKKLAILCMAVLGTMAVATGCDFLNPTSSSTGSSNAGSASVDTSVSTSVDTSVDTSVVTTYTVTVNAPESVVISGELTAEAGEDVTFTATANEIFVIEVQGAELVGEPVVSEGTCVYTYKVAAIAADTTVTISATAKLYKAVTTGSVELVPGAVFAYEDEQNLTLPITAGAYYVEFDYAGTGDLYVGDFPGWLEQATYLTFDEDYSGWTDDGYGLYVEYKDEESTSTDPITVNYTVYSALTYENAPLSGSAYVINSIATPFTFNFTETGIYKISTTEEVTFFDELRGYLWTPTGTSNLFEINDVTAPVTISMAQASINTDSLLTWSIEKVEDKVLVANDNTISQNLGETVKYTFTATEAGAYTVKLTGENAEFFSLAICESMYNFAMNAASAVEFDLDANETVNVYVQYNGNASEVNGWVNDTVLTANVNLEKTGAVGDRKLDVEVYPNEETTFSVLANGTRTLIISNAPAKVVVTWDNQDVTVMMGDTAITSGVSFDFAGAEDDEPLVLIFSNDTAERQELTVIVEQYYEPVYLTLETETTISYNLDNDDRVKLVFSVTDFEEGSAPITYFFAIGENWGVFTDLNSHEPITSFQVTENGSYVFYAKYTSFAWGEVSTTVQITGSKPIPVADFTATLDTMTMVIVTVENNYANDSTVVFTAPTTDKYILKDLRGNGLFAVKGIYFPEQIEVPYSFELEAGDSIVFYVNYNFTEDDCMEGTDIPLDGDYYVNIMISKVVTASVGETTVPVVVSQGMRGLQISTQPVLFVAPKTGTYMVNPGWRVPQVQDVTNNEWVNEFPYTFEAEEGDEIWFDVTDNLWNYQEVGEYYVDLIINKVEIAILGEVATVNVGVSTHPMTGMSSPDQVHVLCTIAEAGTYTITHDGIVNDETNGEWYISSGYEFTTTAANQTIILVVSINPMTNPQGGNVTLTISASTTAA